MSSQASQDPDNDDDSVSLGEPSHEAGVVCDADESDHESNAPGRFYLDMEASESGDDASSYTSDDSPSRSFPRFLHLPYELRQRVWEMFCPELTLESRVWELENIYNGNPMPVVEQPTRNVRYVLSTHRESRAIALRKLPDVFSSPRYDLRFNKHTDIIYVADFLEYGDHEISSGNVFDHPGICDNVINLAIDYTPSGDYEWPLAYDLDERIYSVFPNVKALYLCHDEEGLTLYNVRWCAWPKANVQRADRFLEQTSGGEIGEDLPFVFAWHSDQSIRGDVEKMSGALRVVDDDLMGECLKWTYADNPNCAKLPTPDWQFEVWPMVKFSFESGLERYHDLLRWNGKENDWDFDKYPKSDTFLGDEPRFDDEYESSGIDDSVIDEEDSLTEGDDDLAVLPLSASSSDTDSNEGHECEGHDLGGSSDTDDVEVYEGLPPRTLLPAPTSMVIQLDSDSVEDDEEAPVRRPRQPKRRMVSSGSEDDEGEESNAAAHPAKRRAMVVLSDSDGDSATDDSDDDTQTGQHGEGRNAGSRMSLAERLTQHRRENPVSSGSESGAHDEIPLGGDDYDASDRDESGNEMNGATNEDEALDEGLALEAAEWSDFSGEDGEDGDAAEEEL